MTMESSPEYVKKQLEFADEALSDARYLLAATRLKAAANRAYYAMFHTVHAALAVANVGRPRTHSGAISLFNRHFVRTDQLDVQFARDLQDAYDLRQRSDYEVFVSIGEDQVKEIVQKAEVFVLEIRNLLNPLIDN